MIARRHLVLGMAGLAAGCGFHPLYQQGTTQQAALQAVYVNIIPNRYGQLLRQALQARLEGDDSGVAKQYLLTVVSSESVQALGVQSDNSTTRNRDVGNAVWSLHSVNDPAKQLAGGTVRSVDGYNIIDEQFFYEDMEEDQAQRRLAEALADQIVTGLALYFGKHPPKA
jgi:LPS-assembly lipoprotein